MEVNFKDSKLGTVTDCKPYGEKCPITNVVNSNSRVVSCNEDGTKILYIREGEFIEN